MTTKKSFSKTKYRGVYKRGSTYSYRVSNAPRADGSQGDAWKGGFRKAGEACDARNEALTAIRKKPYAPRPS